MAEETVSENDSGSPAEPSERGTIETGAGVLREEESEMTKTEYEELTPEEKARLAKRGLKIKAFHEFYTKNPHLQTKHLPSLEELYRKHLHQR